MKPATAIPIRQRRRRFSAADNIGIPCDCQECIAAEVTDEPQRRIPGSDGRPLWAHGWVLRRWLDARRQAFHETKAKLAEAAG